MPGIHRRSRRWLSISSPWNRAALSDEIPTSFGSPSSRVVHDAVGRFSDVANLFAGGPCETLARLAVLCVSSDSGDLHRVGSVRRREHRQGRSIPPTLNSFPGWQLALYLVNIITHDSLPLPEIYYVCNPRSRAHLDNRIWKTSRNFCNWCCGLQP